MGQVAERIVDERQASPPVDRALADSAPRIDSQTHENGRVTRPAINDVGREITAAQNGRYEPRRLGDPARASSARSSTAAAAPRPGARTPRARARAADIGRALRRRGSLPRSFARGNWLDGRRFNPGLGGDDGRRFAPDVPGCRTALLLFRLGARLLLGWRWRRWRRCTRQIEHAHRTLRVGKIDLSGKVQEREQQHRVDRGDGGDRAAAVTRADVGPISHAGSTRTNARRCACVTKGSAQPEADPQSPRRRALDRAVAANARDHQRIRQILAARDQLKTPAERP